MNDQTLRQLLLEPQYAVAPTPAAGDGKSSRLLPLDALRGVIMIVMALDHANTFIAHGKAGLEFWGGRFPQYSSALQFLTRFVTHVAAPGFFFLMGASMVLFTASRRGRGWSEGAVVRHFFVRGLFLITLQLFVENRAWALGGVVDDQATLLGVLFGLGGAMILGALLIRLHSHILLGLSIVFTGAAHLLTANPAQVSIQFPLALRLLLIPGFTQGIFVLYPMLPWLALALFGMVFGRWLLHDRTRAYRRALAIGAAFVVLFALVRVAGGFGNIRPAAGSGWIDFLNVVKYPPSLVFTLLTLGVDLLLLAAFTRAGSIAARLLRPVVVLGQNPLFFYIIHLYLYGLIGLAFGPQGTSIPGMYPYWLLGLLLLTPLCWLYGDFKHQKPSESLWRFL